MKDLKEKTLRGGVAKLFGQGAGFVLSITSASILARLLDPKDFGLVAMVTVVTGIYGMFTTAGLSSATVQHATVTDHQLSTLFWVNMLVGGVLALICLVTAPILVAFYHEPRLMWVTVTLAVGFVINAAGVQHTALLQRQMRFGTLTLISVVAQLITLAVGVAMALAGLGYWALVGMSLANPLVSTAAKWLVTKWLPGWPRRGAGIMPMLRFGGTLTLNGFVVYVAYNAEKALLGRFWGAGPLGLYGRAYNLVSIPTENLNGSVGEVAFSALSRIQDDPVRLKSYFLRGYSLVMSMTLPITIFCAIFADEIILILFGPKWQEAAIIFRLLTPTVLIFGMINPFSWLLQSTGLQVRSLKIALVIAPLVVTADLIGLSYGPKGVALAYSTAMTLWLVPHVLWCIHGTNIQFKDLMRAVAPPFLSGLAGAVVAFALQRYCLEGVIPLVRLAVGGAAMVCVYLWVLMFVMGQKTFYLDLVKSVQRSSAAAAQAVEPGTADLKMQGVAVPGCQEESIPCCQVSRHDQ
jgi:PST family polysaccharide transporter